MLEIHSPQFKKIEGIVDTGLDLDEDLWIYCLFKEQRDRDGFRTYNDFKERLARRIMYLEDYLYLSSNTITAIDDNPEKVITEYVGVGTALKLIGEIHDLTEADWEIIPESKVKDLDFFIGFDDKDIIEVECKGTFNRISRSNMRADIEKKKETQFVKEDNHHLLYGVITSFYSDKNKLARVDILDPEPVYLYDDPYKSRLINRLKYYLLHFNYFYKTHFLISLSERINMLKNIKDYKLLKNIALVNRYGDKFDIPISLVSKKPFKDKEHILGEVIEIDKSTYFFHGLEVEACLVSTDF